jgi:hypothetical protein
MADDALLDLLGYWVRERERIRERREAGAPSPLSDNELFQKYRFCNADVQNDRVSRVIFDCVTQPHANHPDLIVALTVCRFTNDPAVIEAVCKFLAPFDAERFLAVMSERAARGETLERRAYVIPGGVKGELKAASLTRELFLPLAAAVEQIRPRPRDTCAAVFERLRRFKYLDAGFITAQIIRDLKQVPPLRNAADWMSFVRSGPGSQKGLNRLLGATTEADIKRERPEPEWHELFCQIVDIVAPRVAEDGIVLDAQSWQNCLCETDKFLRFRSGDLRGARLYRSDDKARAHRSKTTKPVTLPAPVRVERHQRFFYLARSLIQPAKTRIEGLRLVFDIESDGLLDAATMIHCIVAADLDSDRVDAFGPGQIKEALVRLAKARYLTGHNICGFDLPLLQRLHGWMPSQGCAVVDTLITGRLVLPNLIDLDQQATAMGDPPLGKLLGRSSLEAWGARFGIPKIGTDIEVWKTFTPEILERCIGDVQLCKQLWQFLQPDGQPPQALALEHRVAAICDEITDTGIPFDVEAAKQLRARWAQRRAGLETNLRAQFPEIKKFTSRIQLAKSLEARGWVPDKRTEKTGQPVINDELLETLPGRFPEFAGLSEHYLLGRRLGQLSEGKKAWLRNVGPDGHIHGRMIHIGTPHSRAKHLEPNLAQVPNPKKGKPFSRECRELFRSRNGWVCVVCDQAGLQDRGFAHCLSAFDNGAYAEGFSNGLDPHWAAVLALGLVPAETARDKESKAHTALREGAKRFRYAFLYGAGGERIGVILYETIKTATHIDPSLDLMQRLFGTDHPNAAMLKQVGNQFIDRFVAATPGLGRLRQSLRNQAQCGWLPGLDGRRVPVRALYTALNYSVTSSEAVITKRWLVLVRDALGRQFRYGWDGDVVLAGWIHDELVVYCRPKIATQVGDIMVRFAKAAGEFYQLKVLLDAAATIGKSWAGEPDAPESDAPVVMVPPATEPVATVENVIPLVPQHILDDLPARLETVAQSSANGSALPPGGSRSATDDDEPQDEDNGDGQHGDKASDDGEPFDEARLLIRGYQRTAIFNYTLPDATPLYQARRYELRPGVPAIKGREAKTFRLCREVNGSLIKGTGPRRVPYNWPAIMRTGPGAEVLLPEGEGKVDALAKAGLLAATVASHDWAPECVNALAGYHLTILADHDKKGDDYAAAARSKLGPVAASIRVVPYRHLWEQLAVETRGDNPEPHEDIKDWLDKRQGDPAKLLWICRQIPVEGGELDEEDAGELLDSEQPPPRGWLTLGQFCRSFLSGLVAPGDVGKTTLRLTQAIELATGRELLGLRLFGRRRVLFICFEDDRQELHRRMLAICRYHGVAAKELRGWLFFRAVSRAPKLAELDNKGRRRVGSLNGILRRAIVRRRCDLVILDPFIKLHALEESSNPDMDFVCDLLIKIAQDYNIAVDSPAHTHKGAIVAGDADARRGASAQRDAGRLDYTFTVMSEAEARQFGISPDERKRYMRLDKAKGNIQRAIKARWFHLVNVPLGNITAEYPDGDDVQAIETWEPPETWSDISAETLDAILNEMEVAMPTGRRYSGKPQAVDRAAWRVVQKYCPSKTEAQCREIIREWLKAGMLYEAQYDDPVTRKKEWGLFVDPSKRPQS